ncbi:hypothetical protein DPMN_063178 [Dreissena polymorpha]|uniref:Ricin B lectin domain-containing protein n=1 Tax=Dreissena polymorpha TaxID=45954 RepID=A0A9D4CA10_DREPO|nr:hypothetical protein DPMN_063178 [Dreissena polymorpha]
MTLNAFPQFWLLSKEGEFRRDDTCWDTPDGAKVKLYPCHTSKGNQLFEYREVWDLP